MTWPGWAKRLWAAYEGFSRHDGPLVAAGIAYYVALSFFPLLLVLVAGLGYALQWTAAGQDAQQRVLAAIEQQASPNLSEQVAKAMKTTGANAPTGGFVGFIGLVVTAIAIFTQVDYAFDRIWEHAYNTGETWLRWLARLAFKRLKALLVLMGIGGFILIVMIASVVWSGFQTAVADAVAISPWITWAAGFSINIVLNFAAFTAVYKFLPRARVWWSHAVFGAFVSACLWEVGRQALAIYLLRLNYPTAYGIIGSFLAIMLWAYYAMLVLLFGAEVVHACREEQRQKTVPRASS